MSPSLKDRKHFSSAHDYRENLTHPEFRKILERDREKRDMVSKRLWPQKYLAIVTRNINCIPKGVYVIEEAERASISLSVERSIYFGIIAPREKDIQLIQRNDRTLKRLTGVQDFLDGYYELIKRQQHKSIPTLTTPFTYCMIDPSIARGERLH